MKTQQPAFSTAAFKNERFLHMLWDMRKAKKAGIDAVLQRQRQRLVQMVSWARTHSPYYQEHYRALPQWVEDPTLLPVTQKKELMERFDDWLTDREVTLARVQAFVDQGGLIGEPFLGRYRVATTSGTTGVRGVFLIDDRSLRVTNAVALRMLGDWLGSRDLLRLLARGGRLAMFFASGGHFASAVAAAQLRKGSRLRARLAQAFSVQEPLPILIEKLNRFRPAVIAPYASLGALLASEQEAGRLHLNPVLIVLSAEGLPLGEYERIARAFNTKVRHSYAATECPFLSYSCPHGWLHINSDWVLLEPVDTDYRPTPPGEPSHTVLVTNLANRVQPILRYDIGDSILVRPDPCPCGNPLPAVRVQGRSADVLSFPTAHGIPVTIVPLVLVSLVDHIPGIERFQIVQPNPTTLRVRLHYAEGSDPDRIWETVYQQIRGLLTEHKLDFVTLERAEELPQQTTGGKYRAVIPLS